MGEATGTKFNRQGDVTLSPEFKRWYSGQDAKDAGRNDAGGAAGQPAATASGPQRSGPVDAQGRPVVFYHGSRGDITAFDLQHPDRKDAGWLGRGVYGTTDKDLAEDYSRAKRGPVGPNVMPLYFAVANPYPATPEMKRKRSRAPQAYIDPENKPKPESHHLTEWPTVECLFGLRGAIAGRGYRFFA